MDIQELFDNLPKDLQDKIIKMTKPHPLAEIMKPLINQSKEIQQKRKTISYKVISNFASDFFCLRDLKRLEPLLEDYEYMLEYRSLVYNYWSLVGEPNGKYSVRGVCVWTREKSGGGRGVWGCVPNLLFFSSKSTGCVHGSAGRVRVKSIVSILFSKGFCKSK